MEQLNHQQKINQDGSTYANRLLARGEGGVKNPDFTNEIFKDFF